MQLTLLLTVSLNMSHSWFLPMMFCVCSIQKVVPLCFNLLDVKFLIWSIVRFNFSTTILRGIASQGNLRMYSILTSMNFSSFLMKSCLFVQFMDEYFSSPSWLTASLIASSHFLSAWALNYCKQRRIQNQAFWRSSMSNSSSMQIWQALPMIESNSEIQVKACALNVSVDQKRDMSSSTSSSSLINSCRKLGSSLQSNLTCSRRLKMGKSVNI